MLILFAQNAEFFDFEKFKFLQTSVEIFLRLCRNFGSLVPIWQLGLAMTTSIWPNSANLKAAIQTNSTTVRLPTALHENLKMQLVRNLVCFIVLITMQLLLEAEGKPPGSPYDALTAQQTQAQQLNDGSNRNTKLYNDFMRSQLTALQNEATAIQNAAGADIAAFGQLVGGGDARTPSRMSLSPASATVARLTQPSTDDSAQTRHTGGKKIMTAVAAPQARPGDDINNRMSARQRAMQALYPCVPCAGYPAVSMSHYPLSAHCAHHPTIGYQAIPVGGQLLQRLLHAHVTDPWGTTATLNAEILPASAALAPKDTSHVNIGSNSGSGATGSNSGVTGAIGYGCANEDPSRTCSGAVHVSCQPKVEQISCGGGSPTPSPGGEKRHA